MPLRSLFALLGRLTLALLLLAHPCLGPGALRAESPSECCGPKIAPTPHACCCDATASLSGGPAMVAICCDAGELPPYVPGPASYHRQSFERVDLGAVAWTSSAVTPADPPVRHLLTAPEAKGPPGLGLRRHLRVHVLLI